MTESMGPHRFVGRSNHPCVHCRMLDDHAWHTAVGWPYRVDAEPRANLEVELVRLVLVNAHLARLAGTVVTAPTPADAPPEVTV